MKIKYPSLPFDSKFIKELRLKIQKKLEDEEFLAFYFFRPFSIYLSYSLYKYTNISANSITLLMAIYSLLMPLIILIFDAFNNSWIFTLLFSLLYLLDVVDGEVARLRNKTSKWGFTLDVVLWYSIPLTFLFCVESLTSSSDGIGFVVKYLSWLAVLLHLFSSQIRIIIKEEIIIKPRKSIGAEILKFPVTMFGFIFIGIWLISELSSYPKNFLLYYILIIDILYIFKSITNLRKLKNDLMRIDL